MIRVAVSRSSVRCDALDIEEPIAALPDAARATVQLLSRAAEVQRDRRFILTVREPLSQTRRLTDLPPVGRARALRILSLDAARQFREREPVMVDGRWVRTAASTRQFVAAAVPAALLDELASLAAGGGWTLVYAEPADAASGLRWVPRHRERQQARRWRRAGAAAWICTTGIVAGTALLVHRNLEQQRAMLADRLRVLSPRVAALDKLQADKRQIEAEIRLLEGDGTTDPILRRTIRLLASLPDSAYLTRLVVRDTGVAEMSGGASRASALAAAAARAHVPVLERGVTAGGPDAYRRGWQSFVLSTEATTW